MRGWLHVLQQNPSFNGLFSILLLALASHHCVQFYTDIDQYQAFVTGTHYESFRRPVFSSSHAMRRSSFLARLAAELAA